MTPAPALDLTTSLRGDFLRRLRRLWFPIDFLLFMGQVTVPPPGGGGDGQGGGLDMGGSG